MGHAWYFMQANTAKEARRKLKDRFDEYHESVRKSAPKDKLLDYKLDDGWEPLCEFLVKPVPDLPFLRINDREALTSVRRSAVSGMTMILVASVVRYPAFAGNFGHAIMRRRLRVGLIKSWMARYYWLICGSWA